MFRPTLLLMLAASLAAGYSSGPPNRKTGAPDEGTCADCHSDTGPGDSTILSGFAGDSYLPDSTYRLVLAVQYANQRRWGFEITSLDSGGNANGELFIVDTLNTQRSTGSGRFYLKQTPSGSYPGMPIAAWDIGWRAPGAGAGPVKFYWCCNAANNNGSTSGDFALCDSLVVTEGTGISESPGSSRFHWRYSNPARNRVVIHYLGDTDRPVRVYSTQGRLVARITPETEGDGLRVTWDGRDLVGTPVPEAAFFVRLGDGVSSVVKVELVR